MHTIRLSGPATSRSQCANALASAGFRVVPPALTPSGEPDRQDGGLPDGHETRWTGQRYEADGEECRCTGPLCPAPLAEEEEPAPEHDWICTTHQDEQGANHVGTGHVTVDHSLGRDAWQAALDAERARCRFEGTTRTVTRRRHAAGDVVRGTGVLEPVEPGVPTAWLVVEGDDVDRAAEVAASLGWRLRAHSSGTMPAQPLSPAQQLADELVTQRARSDELERRLAALEDKGA